jgi:hypothetical protein
LVVRPWLACQPSPRRLVADLRRACSTIPAINDIGLAALALLAAESAPDQKEALNRDPACRQKPYKPHDAVPGRAAEAYTDSVSSDTSGRRVYTASVPCDPFSACDGAAR